LSYKVVFNHPGLKKHFGKALKKIPSSETQDEIMSAVTHLTHDPRPQGTIKIKPPIDIYNFAAHYRIRINHYRVFYDINDERKIVSIIALRKRDEKTYKD